MVEEDPACMVGEHEGDDALAEAELLPEDTWAPILLLRFSALRLLRVGGKRMSCLWLEVLGLP